MEQWNNGTMEIMYLSYNWLKELVDIPKDLSPEELQEKMTLHTVEVEGVESQKDKFKNIVVGKILEVKPHPDADRLQIAEVDIKSDKLSIVCGAGNIEAGQKVPVALVGAVLPNGLEIKEAKVRGELSQGMLCAEDELGLGEDHSGILILGKNAKAGQNISDYFKLNDTIIEVENKSLTNRPDLMGHLGIAREVAAFLKTRKTPKFNEIWTNRVKKINKDELDIKVEVNDLCPRYLGLKLNNICVQESPEWLQKRLSAVGVRPINNIVDITNYVMLETGQPMHAFDGEKVSAIRVRRSKQEESIKTLDGQIRELPEDALVIADKEKPIALAGIMGGEETEITSQTSTIVLEAANFDPTSIRKTSQKVGLRTDSSSRFEKALDPYLTEIAMAECERLIREVCPKAEADSALTDVATDKDRKNEFGLERGPIGFNLDELNTVSGNRFSKEKVIEILAGLGFKAEEDEEDDKTLKVTIPTWRGTKDISIKEDLIEEVVRIYGYNNLELSMPLVTMASPDPHPERTIERKIKYILSEGAAMTESYNYSFTNEEKLRKLNLDPAGHIRLSNPISNHHTLLKQNLVVNLVDNIKQNQAGYDNISMFEIGSVYLNMAGTADKDSSGKEKLPYQELLVGMIEGGNKRDVFSSVKGKVEYLLDYFDIDFKFTPSELPFGWERDGVFAKIEAEGKNIGVVGEIRPDSLKALGIKKRVAAAEISFKDIVELSSRKESAYRPLSKYPALHRDLAFVIGGKILYNDIKEYIENFSELIEKVELFDVYEGSNLKKGQRSLAFHIIYRSQERTLTAEEVDKIQEELFGRLQEKFGAKLRDF
jgi:phenylalanyl-tRNA synthetase beta chain